MNEFKEETLIDFLKKIANGDEEALKEWEKIISRINETKTYEDQ